MAAGRHDFTLEQGATFDELITYKDANGTPVDLTGYVARMQIREKITDATPVVSLDTTSGITLGGTAGTIHLTIPATTTATINMPKGGVYDLEIESPTGVVTRLLEGKVKFSPEVTR